MMTIERRALLGPGETGTFGFFVPVTLLAKGLSGTVRPRDGGPAPERVLHGLVSTEGVDQQGEVVRQHGIDFGYLLAKGFINWNHSHAPADQIGEPLEAYLVPQDDNKGGSGAEALFLRGFLYGTDEERSKRGRDTTADAAWDLLQHAELARSQGYGRRRIGWSVEGGVLFRQGKILEKTIVRHMALTHEPVNAETYAQAVVAKSQGFAVDERVVLDPSDDAVPHFWFGSFDALAKSLGGPAGAPASPGSPSIEKTMSTGLPGSPAGSGGMTPERLENLDSRITSVLPFHDAVEGLYGPCTGGRRCHDGQRFSKGREGLLTHLVLCRGEDAMRTARALGQLHPAMSR